MRPIKDMVANRERFQARIATDLARLRQHPDLKEKRDEVILPPDDRLCDVCKGFGVIKLDVELDDPRFGKFQPCPAEDCKVRKRLAEERVARMKQALPDNYRDYTFESWLEAIPQHMQAGKYLPFYVARYMADHLKQAFFLSDVLDALGVPYEAYELNGVPFLRANIRGTVEEFQNSYGSSLIFEGIFGTSKTGLAVALMNAVRQRGYSAALIDLAEFIQQMQDTYNRDFDNPLEARARLRSLVEMVDLLVIDDSSVSEKDSEASDDKTRIFTEFIVKPRWMAVNAKPFVLTVNKPYPEFLTHWGGRATSRLTERAHSLRFVGDPVRHRNNPV
jgi:DNA replication protein DnaC